MVIRHIMMRNRVQHRRTCPSQLLAAQHAGHRVRQLDRLSALLRPLPHQRQFECSIKHSRCHTGRRMRLVCNAGSFPALLPATTPWGVWTMICIAGAGGLWAERTKWGKEFSGALISTLIGLAFSNLGLIPPESAVYDTVNRYLLPLAVPLLLIAADLRRVIRETGRLLQVFCCGAISTVLGSLVAFKLMPLRNLGADGWKVAAALTARHIGGAVNFVAVSEQLSVSPSARMAGIAADDLIVSLYFIALYSLARGVPPEPTLAVAVAAAQPTAGLAGQAQASPLGESTFQDDRRSIRVLEGATALALSMLICYLGTSFATALNYRGGSITLITGISVALATAFPNVVASLIPSGEGLAAIIMQVFFASVGASGSIAVVMKTAPSLFLFSAIAITIHLLSMLGFEKLFRFSRQETVLASNANIGGPTTAAGMAAAKGWRSMLVPSLLIGVMGYAVATFVGVGMSVVLQRMQWA